MLHILAVDYKRKFLITGDPYTINEIAIKNDINEF